MSLIKAIESLFMTENVVDEKVKYSMPKIIEFVEMYIDQMSQSTLEDITFTVEELQNAKERKKLFKKELSLCGLGDISAKQFIKSWISDLITQKYDVNEDNIDYFINFDFPTPYDKFVIVLHKYISKYKFEGLEYMIHENDLDKLKEYENERLYVISDEDINEIYMNKFSGSPCLTFEDKLDILVQRIYENTHGLSVIDNVRDQKIEGLSLGVSGVPVDFVPKITDMAIKGERNNYKLSFESVWLYFEGKEIYMPCLSFGTEREFERVCKRLYRFNNQKQFAKSDGFIFNNMADISRISVFRPPFAESWAAFIRKFDVDGNIQEIIHGKNEELVRKLYKYIIRGKKNICYTGPQGAGKTTMLIAGLKQMYPSLTIRVWEAYFETFLRIKMPNRNILTLREIEELNGEKALDSFKKSNGQVSVIAEAATDEVISYIIKSCLAASECVHWTHHANSAASLVMSHRNACINAGVFKDENIAEDQVLSVLNYNIHRNKTGDGKRYIERITEFVQLDDKPFSQGTSDEDFRNNSRMYYERKTGAAKYKAVNLVEYDLKTDTFLIKNPISKETEESIYDKLADYDREDFTKFVEEFNDFYKEHTN